MRHTRDTDRTGDIPGTSPRRPRPRPRTSGRPGTRPSRTSDTRRTPGTRRPPTRGEWVHRRPFRSTPRATPFDRPPAPSTRRPRAFLRRCSRPPPPPPPPRPPPRLSRRAREEAPPPRASAPARAASPREALDYTGRTRGTRAGRRTRGTRAGRRREARRVRPPRARAGTVSGRGTRRVVPASRRRPSRAPRARPRGARRDARPARTTPRTRRGSPARPTGTAAAEADRSGPSRPGAGWSARVARIRAIVGKTHQRSSSSQ